MTISRKFTSVATAIALAVTSLGTLTTAASAHDGYRGYGGGGYGGGRHYSRRYDDGYRGDYGYRGGRDRYYARKKKNNTGISTRTHAVGYEMKYAPSTPAIAPLAPTSGTVSADPEMSD